MQLGGRQFNCSGDGVKRLAAVAGSCTQFNRGTQQHSQQLTVRRQCAGQSVEMKKRLVCESRQLLNVVCCTGERSAAYRQSSLRRRRSWVLGAGESHCSRKVHWDSGCRLLTASVQRSSQCKLQGTPRPRRRAIPSFPSCLCNGRLLCVVVSSCASKLTL